MTRSFSSLGIMCLHCLLLIVVGQNNSYDNVALKKQSKQSTTLVEWEAHKAVDNNSRSCSSTNGSANDWWEVNLGQYHHIQDITIVTDYNRSGVHSTSISVDGLMCSNIIENASIKVHFRCSQTIYGRKVRITKEHNATDKFLVICEFIVSGCTRKYGEGCYYHCGQCTESENCNYENGHCRNCVPGKKYPNCKNNCDDGSYGHNCSEKCGNCKDPNTCDKSTGNCSSCQEGYVVPLCKPDMMKSTAVERTTKTTLSTKERETTKATTGVNAVDTNLGLIGGVASVIVIVIVIILIIIIIMIRKRKRTCEKMSSSDAIDSGVNSSKPDSGLKPQVGGDSVETFHMVDCAIYEGTDVGMG